tara:strand:- start:73098 stop:73355 length:258 start_codon:yes stop_codon:yes gene_type:complete
MLLTDTKIGLLNPLRGICREPQIPLQSVWNIGRAISTSAHSFATQMHSMLKKFFIWVKSALTDVALLVHTIMWIWYFLAVVYMSW